MAKRTYRQYCGLATALDLLGERWTVLIIRDLLLGPKRFTDLNDRLVGIGTGLLSQRLRELEDASVISKEVLPPPAASTVYRLTAYGEELRPALLSLIRWGAKRLGEPAPDQRVDIESLALAMTAHHASGDRSADGVYGLVLDGKPFELRIATGVIQIATQPATQPRATITSDTATMIALNNGTLSLRTAIESGALMVEADPATVVALGAAFPLDAERDGIADSR